MQKWSLGWHTGSSHNYLLVISVHKTMTKQIPPFLLSGNYQRKKQILTIFIKSLYRTQVIYNARFRNVYKLLLIYRKFFSKTGNDFVLKTLVIGVNIILVMSKAGLKCGCCKIMWALPWEVCCQEIYFAPLFPFINPARDFVLGFEWEYVTRYGVHFQ